MREKSSTISTSTATNIHRPLQSAPASLTHERDFSTIFNNFQIHRIYKLTNLATFLDKPYGSVRRCHQCCPASARSDSPGRPVAIVDILTYRTIYGYERDHFWCRDYIATDHFFIIKNNDYINFYIKMNITNILVDRATSVISSALCSGGGA